MAKPIDEFEEGAIFAGRYRVVRLLASGAMGAVHEVIHLETERRRALKVLHTHVLAAPGMRARFALEARIAARVESEHIVEVFDAGFDEATERPFLVMELLRGEELGQRLRRVERFEREEAMVYLRQLALALDKTHKAAIVHRDLKPSNLFRAEREDGTPRLKVLDFGVAKLLAESGGDRATRLAGTPLYMSPEQLRGDRVGPAADLFALGMMAFTFLVGEAYWARELRAAPDVLAFALAAARGPDEPASVRAARSGQALPPGFDAWFARATAPSPDRRFAAASEAIRALEDALAADGPGGGPAVVGLNGKPLRAYVGDVGVSMEARVRWLAAAARAIHAANEAFSDVGADELIVIADGRVALRSAPRPERDAAGGTLTDEDGAPSPYLAPEQIEDGEAGPRTAQFAWGVAAYELLSGAPPWPEGTPETLLPRILSEPPASLRERSWRVPEAVDRAVIRALAARPEDRHPSLLAIAELLDAALDEPSRGDPPAQGAQPPPEEIPTRVAPAVARDQEAPAGGEPREGALIAGRFEIERVAGAGGMGTVYRAIDRVTGAPVALKVLHAHLTEEAARFAREAEILAELRHPAIVRHVAHGAPPRGRLFLAMEWIEGETLAARIARQGLTLGETLALGRRIASALAAAHGRGVVHRDVKPSNVILPAGDPASAMLVDFGVARVARPAERLTATGAMIGTPGFMAPEQARGEPGVDARADVFSLGVLLFQCLTGRAAFEGDAFLTVLLKVVLEEVPRARSLAAAVPPALDDLVARMLEKDPELRPADGAAIAAALAEITPDGDGPAAPSTAPMRAITMTERRVTCLVLARPPRHAEIPAAALRESVALHGARLDVLADGSMLALLTTEAAATDLAARAARAALAMREALPDAPMALVTGRGELDERRGTGALLSRGVDLVADTVAGGVRIDDTTAGLVGPRFDVRHDGRGLVLHGERELSVVRRTLLGKVTPCVGRDREIAVLSGILDECEGERVAQAALVVGPPGIGKSRLRDELLRRVREERPHVEVWLGRGDPMSAGSPFGLVGQAIRRAAGLRAGEPIEAQRGKLRARVGRHIHGDRLARVSAFVGEIASVPFDYASAPLRAARESAIVMGDQVRRAFCDLLEAECAARPLVLVLEDLHWGDRPSIELVDAALRNLEGLPLMVLALARPEVSTLAPELWTERRVQTLRLGELTRRASEALVREALGPDAAADTVAQIVDRAGGNAFFLEELVHAAAEGKGEALPETVLAVIEARLAKVPPEGRRALRAASVLGRTFWRGALAGMMGRAARIDLPSVLDDLVRRELVKRSPEARFPGEEELSFRHALVRDAAYAMLTDEDRALAHQHAAAWLERAGERDAALLAEHFERGGAAARAIGWYRRAAEEALAGDDLAAADTIAARGLACGAEGEVAAALLLTQAEAHKWRGRSEESFACAARAAALLAVGSAPWYGALAAQVAANHRDREAMVAIGEALAAATPGPGLAGAFVVAAARVTVPLLHIGRYELAGTLLSRLDAAGDLDLSDHPVATAWRARARSFRAMYDGDVAAYLALGAEAAACFAEAGDLRSACAQQTGVGHAYLELGQHRRAAEVLREAASTAQRMGLAVASGGAHNNLGLALARLGEPEEARRVEEEAIRIFAAQGDDRMVAACRIYLAIALIAAGDLDAAEREASAAVEGSEQAPAIRVQAQATLASALLARGEPASALEAAEAASAGLAALGGTIEEGEAQVRLVHAEALLATGLREPAHRAIDEASRRLLARAAKITDPELRTSFLFEVPENKRTLALANAWLH